MRTINEKERAARMAAMRCSLVLALCAGDTRKAAQIEAAMIKTMDSDKTARWHKKRRALGQSWRSAKAAEQSRRWRLKNPERAKDFRYQAKYGITHGDKTAMMRKQKNKCPICRRSFGPGLVAHVDHCHIGKKVRGVLCGPCNQAIGLFKESAIVLRSAIRYLKRAR